jgi:lysophospholipase L1-like esterase
MKSSLAAIHGVGFAGAAFFTLAMLTAAAPQTKTTERSTKQAKTQPKRRLAAKSTARPAVGLSRAKQAARLRRGPVVSAAVRSAARDEVERKMAAVETGVENPSALANYFAALDHASDSGKPVHILQFGDSHTASDDWVNAMRIAAQSLYGDGGPGYVHAGHPYLGYRRFDTSGANSTGWKTDGNKSIDADPNQGVSHVSISTSLPSQTVRLTGSGETLGIFFMRQPGGGQFELTFDGDEKAVVSTDLANEPPSQATADASAAATPTGDSDANQPGPGYFFHNLPPGRHEIMLRTMNFAPVRLFGWTLDNAMGVTFETLGINGALASKLLDANERIWASELAQRGPALVILAYGTNEANSRTWTAEQYRADLTEIVARIRRAVPGTSILMVGPPDCGKLRPLLHLAEVIDIQREMAGRLSVAFWDWRMHMGGDRIVGRWVVAGLGQGDYVHLTGEGYRLVGNLLFAQLEKAHSENRHE